jgi:hypothetical protein
MLMYAYSPALMTVDKSSNINGLKVFLRSTYTKVVI